MFALIGPDPAELRLFDPREQRMVNVALDPASRIAAIERSTTSGLVDLLVVDPDGVWHVTSVDPKVGSLEAYSVVRANADEACIFVNEADVLFVYNPTEGSGRLEGRG